MKNNKIIKIQEMLLNQMERLNDDELIKSYAKRETLRSGALSQSACAYIKAINTSLKIKELSKNNEKAEESLLKELGIKDEK